MELGNVNASFFVQTIYLKFQCTYIPCRFTKKFQLRSITFLLRFLDATEMFNTTLTCTGKEVYIGNMFLVQYLQGYITLICPTRLNDTSKKTMTMSQHV